MTQRKKFSRRAALAGMGLALGGHALDRGTANAAQPAQPTRDPLAAIPVNGQAGPGLEPFDAAMRTIIDRHGLPGAALAIAKDGAIPARLAGLEPDAVDHAVPGEHGDGRSWPGIGTVPQVDSGELRGERAGDREVVRRDLVGDRHAIVFANGRLSRR